MPRFRQFIALLLLVLWTPVVSHCLLEEVVGAGDSGCCESRDYPAPDHSDCAECSSVEKGQLKTDATMLPAPAWLVLAPAIFDLMIPSPAESAKGSAVIREPADTPPVPPAELILQATIAQPVRGPALVG